MSLYGQEDLLLEVEVVTGGEGQFGRLDLVEE